MQGPPLIEFDPVALGPVQLARVPLAGAWTALAFLLALALATRLATRAALPRGPVLELFAVGAPLAFLASRAPALLSRFPAFLHDARSLVAALLAPGSLALGALAACALAGAFAWASRRAPAFLDAVAPGGALVAAAAAAGRVPELRTAAFVLASGLLVAGAGGLIGRHARAGIAAAACAAAGAVLLATPGFLAR